MRIAVINEESACLRNKDIIEALSGYSHEVFNVGMTGEKNEPAYSYIHTAFMTAMLLKVEAVDFVIGGCGTGEGYMLSANQYPNVYCGLIYDPLEAWLFVQINAGHAVSLALNKCYGWAAEENLKLIFDALFNSPVGAGYPCYRKEAQKKFRIELEKVSTATHKNFADIINSLDKNIMLKCAESEKFLKLISESKGDIAIRDLYLKQISM